MAASVRVQLVLSEPGGVYFETAGALRAEVERSLPGRVEWRVDAGPPPVRAAAPPHWVVAVGTAAHRQMLSALVADQRPPPLLAVLVPRTAFVRGADPVRVRAGLQSAVFIDQPPARQLELIRLALPPIHTVGMLLGESSQALESEFLVAARDKGLQLLVRKAEQDQLSSALQMVLPDVEALLAVPDPGVFNSQTAPNILAATYRQRVPLIGFSPAYTRAGALVSLYSTPAQVGRRGGEMLVQAIASGKLPSPQGAREFLVSVNHDVARSFGLTLSEEQLAGRLRQAEQP